MPRIQLAAIVASLLWLWQSCGTVASASADEIARIPVNRPAVVVVERTDDGGVRVILEFKPWKGPEGPGPNPNPTPEHPAPVPQPDIPPAVIDLVDEALGSVDPEARPALASAIADDLATIDIKPGDTGESLGQLILSRLPAVLGVEHYATAVLVAAGVGDHGPLGDRPLNERIAALRAALLSEAR